MAKIHQNPIVNVKREKAERRNEYIKKLNEATLTVNELAKRNEKKSYKEIHDNLYGGNEMRKYLEECAPKDRENLEIIFRESIAEWYISNFHRNSEFRDLYHLVHDILHVSEESFLETFHKMSEQFGFMKIVPESEFISFMRLQGFNEAYLSLYRILAIQDEYMTIKDILLDEETKPLKVYGGRALDFCKVGDIAGLRVVTFNDEVCVGNGICLFDQKKVFIIAIFLLFRTAVARLDFDTPESFVNSMVSIAYRNSIAGRETDESFRIIEEIDEMFDQYVDAFKNYKNHLFVIVDQYSTADTHLFEEKIRAIDGIYKISEFGYDFYRTINGTRVLAYIEIQGKSILVMTSSEEKSARMNEFFTKFFEEECCLEIQDHQITELSEYYSLGEDQNTAIPFLYFGIIAARILEDLYFDWAVELSGKKNSSDKNSFKLLAEKEKKRAKRLGVEPANMQRAWNALGVHP